MSQEPMDLQKITFFTEGNTFTGSRTQEDAPKKLLRYLVRPDKENNVLSAYSWRSDVCFESAEETASAEFPLSEEGLQQVQAWLQDQYASL